MPLPLNPHLAPAAASNVQPSVRIPAIGAGDEGPAPESEFGDFNFLFLLGQSSLALDPAPPAATRPGIAAAIESVATPLSSSVASGARAAFSGQPPIPSGEHSDSHENSLGQSRTETQFGRPGSSGSEGRTIDIRALSPQIAEALRAVEARLASSSPIANEESKAPDAPIARSKGESRPPPQVGASFRGADSASPSGRVSTSEPGAANPLERSNAKVIFQGRSSRPAAGRRADVPEPKTSVPPSARRPADSTSIPLRSVAETLTAAPARIPGAPLTATHENAAASQGTPEPKTARSQTTGNATPQALTDRGGKTLSPAGGPAARAIDRPATTQPGVTVPQGALRATREQPTLERSITTDAPSRSDSPARGKLKASPPIEIASRPRTIPLPAHFAPGAGVKGADLGRVPTPSPVETQPAAPIEASRPGADARAAVAPKAGSRLHADIRAADRPALADRPVPLRGSVVEDSTQAHRLARRPNPVLDTPLERPLNAPSARNTRAPQNEAAQQTFRVKDAPEDPRIKVKRPQGLSPKAAPNRAVETASPNPATRPAAPTPIVSDSFQAPGNAPAIARHGTQDKTRSAKTTIASAGNPSGGPGKSIRVDARQVESAARPVQMSDLVAELKSLPQRFASENGRGPALGENLSGPARAALASDAPAVASGWPAGKAIDLENALPGATERTTRPEAPEMARQLRDVAHVLASRLEGSVRIGEREIQADLRLDPPDLGRVRVQLTVGNDKSVEAKFVVEQAATARLLTENMNSFKEALGWNGLKAPRVLVTLETRSAAEDLSHENRGYRGSDRGRDETASRDNRRSPYPGSERGRDAYNAWENVMA